MSSTDKNSYNVYAGTPCRDIPIEHLKGFILTFLYDASKDMGVVLEKEILPDRVYYIISTHYHHLPLSLVASAFKRGALGQYGAGRLIARTVYGWLGEMNQYYMTLHEKKEEQDNEARKFDGLERYPMGKAICWKIDHVSYNDWDNVPLKEVAEMIGRGSLPTLEHFGIINK